MPCFWTKPPEESLALQVHRRELMEAVEAAREPLGFPSVMAMVQDRSVGNPLEISQFADWKINEA